MGSVKRDMHEGERRLDASYALDHAEGIEMLLGDYHELISRKYNGDYDAVVILADLQTAIDRADLTEAERLALKLVYIDDMNQTEAGEAMGVRQQRVSRLLKRAHVKLARVYEYWCRHDEGYTITSKEVT